MADLSIDFCGVKSPNPFWLASAPPTNTGDQVKRAFDAGWGGAVWKTLGNPIVNVSSRFGGVDYGSTRMMGLNNIELITDRPLQVNLDEMADVKKQYPAHTLIASLMVDTREEWHEIIQKVEDIGSDMLELNFGCPHGMCERGMGSAVGAEPEVLKTIVGWVMEKATVPVIVKLTPNVGDIAVPAQAALEAGADAVSLINTVKSIVGVDLDRMVPLPVVGNGSSNGGYCGPAVKPIALHLLGQTAKVFPKPISGIGGIATWRDAAEFMALGSTSVQVCTAVMHYGYRIVEDMIEGLESLGINKILQIELGVSPDTNERGMTASGMIVINPPWKLESQMNEILPFLKEAIAPATGHFKVEWIAIHLEALQTPVTSELQHRTAQILIARSQHPRNGQKTYEPNAGYV